MRQFYSYLRTPPKIGCVAQFTLKTMTVSKQIRIPTGLLALAQERAKKENESTNAILCDAIRRGLMTYEMVRYRPIKTTLDLRLLAKQTVAMTEFLKQDLIRLNNALIEDTSDGERQSGQLCFDLESAANSLDDDDDFLLDDVNPADMATLSGWSDQDLVDLLRTSKDDEAELQKILNSAPSESEVMNELNEIDSLVNG